MGRFGQQKSEQMETMPPHSEVSKNGPANENHVGDTRTAIGSPAPGDLHKVESGMENGGNQSSARAADEGGGFEITPGTVVIPETESSSFSFRKLWAFTGPGFLMSIAYLDPGNIESDLQSGAVAEYKLLWVLMWCTVMGLVIQLLAARLGNATGYHLAQVCYREYPRFPRLLLWLMIEIAIIGSDIQEVVGSAIAINLLSSGKIPIFAGCLITGIDTFTFLFLEQAGLRKLEALFGALISTMAFSFFYMYITVKPDQGEILKGLWFPWCEGCELPAIQQAVGIVGAVIMPHNIYLHSALVLSRRIDHTDRRRVREANMYYSIESAIALFISFLINLFVVAVFAAAFYQRANPSLMNAGLWIGEKYGNAMKIIWGIGILAAGQSSTMTGTYAGQFAMEGFLGIHWAKWKRVLLTRSIAMVPTILVAVLATKALDQLNNVINVIQSIQLPFALLPVLYFTSQERLMGEFQNSRFTKVIVWALAILVMGVNFYLVFAEISNSPWWTYLLIAVLGVLYVIFVGYLAFGVELSHTIKCWVLRRLGRMEYTRLEEEFTTSRPRYPQSPSLTLQASDQDDTS
ncbi:natural resistance-associated macrophage protein 1-like [Diadema antillarum]|uniref:natural resistance-associated macrophage protein 1-like n=1 Tax=Diadema antillarum TaxID=105358 RepID=UPI003A8A03B2